MIACDVSSIFASSIHPSAFAPAMVWPLKLEFFNGLTATLLFLGLALFFVSLGLWSLAGLGPIRKWVAIGIRLAVALCFVLILGGARWPRPHKGVATIVVRAISDSGGRVPGYSSDD